MSGHRTRLARIGVLLVLMGCGIAVSACSTSSTGAGLAPAAPAGAGVGVGKPIAVAASINAWGSILSQLGGTRVRASSIITNPDTDPHDYEPTPADGRTIASAALFVENGIGYDSWASKTIAANPSPSQVVINVGDLVGVAAGGNPHRWYSPTDVERVSAAITAGLKKVDPTDGAYFDAQLKDFENTGLARYHQLIADIRSKYSAVAVGASESIFSPLAQALGLDLVTPPSFLKAISEGTDPAAADKSTIDAQISGKKIKVYVFNSQNATPDVAAQVAAAKKAGIAVSTVTETLTPAGTSFQDWQVSQLLDLQAALAKAL